MLHMCLLLGFIHLSCATVNVFIDYFCVATSSILSCAVYKIWTSFSKVTHTFTGLGPIAILLPLYAKTSNTFFHISNLVWLCDSKWFERCLKFNPHIQFLLGLSWVFSEYLLSFRNATAPPKCNCFSHAYNNIFECLNTFLILISRLYILCIAYIEI